MVDAARWSARRWPRKLVENRGRVVQPAAVTPSHGEIPSEVPPRSCGAGPPRPARQAPPSCWAIRPPTCPAPWRTPAARSPGGAAPSRAASSARRGLRPDPTARSGCACRAPRRRRPCSCTQLRRAWRTAAASTSTARNEGIRSAARHFPEGAGAPATLVVKRRCRVLAATRHRPPPRPRRPRQLAGARSRGLGLGIPRLDVLPRRLRVRPPRRGHRPAHRLPPRAARRGARARLRRRNGSCRRGGVGALGPAAEAVLLERDAIALVAASRNLPGATLVLGRSVADVPGPFDLVASNPPVHAARVQSLATVEDLVAKPRPYSAPPEA